MFTEKFLFNNEKTSYEYLVVIRQGMSSNLPILLQDPIRMAIFPIKTQSETEWRGYAQLRMTLFISRDGWDSTVGWL